MNRDFSSLHRLAQEHPLLEPLRHTAWGQALLTGAAPLALHLAGAPHQEEHWLVDLLRVIAPQELTWMRQMCRHSALRAGSAAASILRHLFEQAPPPPQEPEGDDDDQGDDQDGDQGDAQGDEQGEAEGGQDATRRALEALTGCALPPETPVPEDIQVNPEEDGADRFGLAVSESLKLPEVTLDVLEQAQQQSRLLEQLHQIMPGSGWGQSAGGLEEHLQQNWDRVATLMDRMSSLTRIVEELGRMERDARSQRRAQNAGRERVTGVRVGGELSDVLPGELALLGDGHTEDLFYQRYAEHRLICLELEGSHADPEGQRRGPVVACVDTSGSMQGDPEVVAKALVLSTLRRVLPQNRRVRLILFGGPGDRQEIDITRGARATGALLDFLGMSFYAGTDFDGPLVRAMELMQEEAYERADVLVLTDGLCRASQAVVRRVEQARQQRHFRVVTVVVGGDPRGVEGFSDQVWRVRADQDLPEGFSLDLWRSPQEPPAPP
jgi:Mg-chelatase subunit ChlD